MRHSFTSKKQLPLSKHVLFACLQEDLKSTYFLWQLFHIDQDLSKARKRMGKEDEALQAAARSAILAEKEIAAKKKEQAGYHLERIKLDRQLKRRRTETDQKVAHAAADCVPFAPADTCTMQAECHAATQIILFCADACLLNTVVLHQQRHVFVAKVTW